MVDDEGFLGGSEAAKAGKREAPNRKYPSRHSHKSLELTVIERRVNVNLRWALTPGSTCKSLMQIRLGEADLWVRKAKFVALRIQLHGDAPVGLS
jgi:hypothetical protein